MARKKSANKVELNTSSMFDMGFQLLAFFILTFKPNPIEGQITLRLPPPVPVNAPQTAKPQAGQDSGIKGVDTLTITVVSRGGGVDYMVGEQRVMSVPALEAELRKIFGDKGNPFEQVIVQVGREVLYEDLMKVVEACAKQRMPDGTKLSKLSFVEITGG